MKAIGVFLATLVSAASLTVAASVAFSCGFEDPKSASGARGILNFMYPKALYVSTAVWRAQLDGVIACDDPPQKDRSIVAGRSKYDMAVAHLARLHDKLSGGLDGSPKPAFSLVLLGPMLWTRFVPEGHGIAMTPHVKYAEANDVVIVTDQPVIAALVEGRMRVPVAIELGLIRFYGPADKVAALTSLFDGIPTQSSRLAMPATN